MHERDYPLHVFGPRGCKERIQRALGLGLMRKDFEIRVVEVKRAGKILEEESFEVAAFPLKHEVPCLGFAFNEKDKKGEFQRAKAIALGIPEGPLWGRLQKGAAVKWKGRVFRPEQVMDYGRGRKGRKVSIVVDTRPAESYYDYIWESDVLVHEAAFSERHAQRAKETKHSTAMGAARVALETKAKKLVLTHISPRHKKNQELENEARQVFANVVVAEDLMQMEL
jgi:ribonuclease Z